MADYKVGKKEASAVTDNKESWALKLIQFIPNLILPTSITKN